MKQTERHNIAGSKYHNIWIMLCVVVGLLFSFSVFFSMKDYERQTVESDLKQAAGRVAEALEHDLSGKLKALVSLWALQAGTDNISRPQFESLASHLLERHPDITAFEWVPAVSRADRARAERANADYSPGFKITQWADASRLETAPEREQYFPVYYSQPAGVLDSRLGFDLATDPDSLAALKAAAKSAAMALSAPVRLIAEHQDKNGILAVIPLYKGQVFPENKSHKPEGFLVEVWQPGDQLAELQANYLTEGIKLALLDQTDVQSSQVIYAAQPEGDWLAAEAVTAPVMTELNRVWTLVVTPESAYFAARSSYTPLLVLCLGLLFTLLLSVYLFVLGRRAREMAIIVSRHTAELEAAQLRADAVAVTDRITGLFNKRHFDYVVANECRRSVREFTPLTLMFFELDNFEQYAESYGQQKAEACLKAVAEQFKQRISRPGDLIARYSEDRFVCLLPSTNEQVIELAARCCEEVRQLNIAHKGTGSFEIVTISIGVATMLPSRLLTPERLVATAETVLLEAKEAGGDRYIASAESSSDISSATYSV
ncbi:MAG: sensor domain-containing diguanylate cyclase [Pontibacterium sp.]